MQQSQNNYGSPTRSSSVFHTMYAPKVIALVSRQYQPEAFRVSLILKVFEVLRIKMSIILSF